MVVFVLAMGGFLLIKSMKMSKIATKLSNEELFPLIRIKY